jgi:hypothetical protein
MAELKRSAKSLMHPLLMLLLALVGGAAAFWLALRTYGMIRGQKPEDKKKSRVRLTQTSDADGGGADGH